ncbi:MAG: hypothetical protein IID46_00490 [Planctomycetes bacterium]|nr:hypothetical protein [Planctomycetota bacterium]
MATDLETQTDLEAFHKFIGELLKKGKRKLPVEESLVVFREYQQELERLREEIRPALERAAKGEGKEIDLEDILRRGRERLAKEGVSD